jgi:glycosyltransferase involved in cell wall biosynthesis
MNKNPKVSIIIPTYNRADLMPRAVNSVLNQIFKDFELIIIDDGSTDNTKQVVDEFQKKDKRIKYIWQENSGTPSKPKNTGIKNSYGEYIAFLDSDDEWLPKKLKKQLNVFKNSKKEDLGFVGCNALIVNEKTGTETVYNMPLYNDKIFFEKLLKNNFIWSSSGALVKKEVFEKIGLFDEKLKYGEDWDMWIRIAQKYNFDFVPEVLFKYYIHSSSVTNTTPVRKKDKDLMYIFDKHKEYYLSYPQIYSSWLRRIGTMYILNGDPKKGRGFFLKSIKINVLNIKSYLYFLISFGGRGFYHWLTQRKMKLRKYKIFRKINL